LQINISDEQRSTIRTIPRLRESEYAEIDIDETLNFFYKRYVIPLGKASNIEKATVCDCGTGFGWFAFAYLLAGGHRAILCEYEERRLAAAKRIAEILCIAEQCQFICCSLHQLPLRNNTVDISVSIETLEHVGKDRISSSVGELARIARGTVLLTSPNFFFPFDQHDTGLPFIHWLPETLKPLFARLFGRERTVFNSFPTPLQLRALHSQFRPISGYYNFASRKEWLSSYPQYNPYDQTHRSKPSSALALTLIIAQSILRRYSFVAAPNLAGIWRRRDPPRTTD
jgi:ubiquinone/menaquinone biosynthesis C-methylase UbiE